MCTFSSTKESVNVLYFQHISCCYEKQKETSTHFLLLFSLGLGLKKALTASIHGRILSSNQKRNLFYQFSTIY
ncbi:hypothetical protein CN590_13385 [Bacillus pseudomycoides]|nr:hypothetical protein CN590_13385 [Bacillus pseudomycoides]